MDSQHKFSVIIATYNRKDYVLQAIESVVQQTYPAYEIIVVVDGSTDDTSIAIKAQYPNVIVFEQPNLGRPVAINTGISLTTGNWVCFLDDDDLWHRTKLEITATYLATHPDCQAVRNPIWFFSDSEDGPKSVFGFERDFVAKNLEECHAEAEKADPDKNDMSYLLIEGNSYKLLLERNLGVMSSSVIERQTLIRAGCFQVMQSYADDWLMFLNVARLCEWHTIPQRLGFTRFHKTQSTGNVINGLFIIVSKVTIWFSGRPLPGNVSNLDMLKVLVNYSQPYRSLVQEVFWNSLRKRKFLLAVLSLQLGTVLLPRFQDKLYVLIPPQITWRWQRYIGKSF